MEDYETRQKNKRIAFIVAFILYVIISILYLVFASIFLVDFSNIITGTEIIGHIGGVIVAGGIFFSGWYYIERNSVL